MSLALLPAALAAFLAVCAPQVDPATEAPLIFVETHGVVWALHDDVDSTVPAAVAAVPHVCGDAGCEYEPRSYSEALATAGVLIARSEASPKCRRGVSGPCAAGVDVGIGQLNSNNFARFGVDAATMLRPCENLRKSSALLNDMFQGEYAAMKAPTARLRTQWALRRAYEVYNSGSAYGAPAYLAKIIAAAHEPYVISAVRVARALQRQLSANFHQPDVKVAELPADMRNKGCGRVPALNGCLRVNESVSPSRLTAGAAILVLRVGRRALQERRRSEAA
jgi:type IV secretion system protein VirB1